MWCCPILSRPMVEVILVSRTILGTDGSEPDFLRGCWGSIWVLPIWVWPIFSAGLVSLTTTCLSRQLTAQTGSRWRPASKHLSFILYCPSGLPSPYPPGFSQLSAIWRPFLRLPDLDRGEQRRLCSLLNTVAVPNRLELSDLLTHAFRII